MKTRNKIGIVVVILVFISTLGILAFTYSIESSRAQRILDATMNCIGIHDNATPCIQICEGTLNDTAYDDLRLLNKEDCRPYINNAIDKFDR